MRKLILCFVPILIILNAASASDTDSHRQPTEIPIKEAIAKGLATIQIRGAYGAGLFYEILDQSDGLHYGKCIAFQMRSNVDSIVLLKLDAGTLLIPTNDSVQKMLVTHDVLFPLVPGGPYWTRIYAMCSQLQKEAPETKNVFSIGEKGDTNLVKLAQYLELSYNQNMAGQHAVWAYTDCAGTDVLGHYGADSNSLKRSIEILNAVNIITPLNKPLAKSEVEQKPATTITLNSYIIYTGAWLILLLSLTTIAVWGRRKRRNTVVV